MSVIAAMTYELYPMPVPNLSDSVGLVHDCINTSTAVYFLYLHLQYSTAWWA